ncbi:MAG TPA: DNA polymerase I [Actinomycetota bacterium]|nr:DNA polymerase I [Actinomycetota bacterium]
MAPESGDGTATGGSGEPERRPRLFLLDGHSLSYRAFFALPETLATSTGQVTNAVYGFTSMLIKLLSEERPERIAVAFDLGTPKARLERYSEYKAGRRETPDEFRQQLGLILEVVETLRIPLVSHPEQEADDLIATLALRAVDEGFDVVIVTADRDFFQVVRPGITVMFNRRGISDIVTYDVDAVTERFGLPPSKYLDYVALKGDSSDNIPGVPGVGEKTASQLIQQYGSVEELLRHTEELKPRVKAGIEAAGDQLLLNKDIARLDTSIELDLDPAESVMGEWDEDQVRRLFTSLEFRTLLERLEDVRKGAAAAEWDTELDLTEGTGRQLRDLAGKGPVAVRLHTEGEGLDGMAASTGEGRAVYAAFPSPEADAVLAEPVIQKWVHDAKELQSSAARSGREVEGVVFDTLLAGYLLDPAEATYELPALSIAYLGVDVLSGVEEEQDGQLFANTWRPVAAEAAAVALLAPAMERRIDRAGLRYLLEEVELPLAGVLALMQARGVALDVPYLEDLSASATSRMTALQIEIWNHAGREFNLNSPPQLREILYGELGLSPGKKTPKGQLSTDASVLEKLRDQHPIVDALLQWRELDKLNSTYLVALPRLVNPATGRVHTTFNQAVAATGRLSSTNPNLQNIPVRGEEGRRIRRAFVPGDPSRQVLVCADYSQIELRIMAHLSGDEGLAEAFATGVDIHTATSARVFGLPIDQVDPQVRSRAKMINYGLAYGMNAFGLASRLGIAVDEAQEFVDAYFAGFPKIREYLDKQVGRAAAEGFTETLLGRRRYIPELQAANPRVRDLGRRMALNAPIQGGASDVFKLAMIRVDRALREHTDLDCHMLLTVHDELVFEVASDHVEEASDLVKREMEAAYELTVPLRADIGWGANWAEAAPAGH